MSTKTLFALLSLLVPSARAAVTLPYTFSSGNTIQSAQVNANFVAIVNEINNVVESGNPNNITLAEILAAGNSCGASNVNFNGNQLTDFAVENLSADASPSLQGRLWWNTTTKLLKLDTGASILTVGGSGTNNLASVLNSGNTTGGLNIDMQESQLLRARVENLTSDPSFGNPGRLYILTGNSTLKLDTGSSIVAIGGSQSLSSVLGVSNSAGSTNLDMNGNQILHMVLDKESSDPGTNLTGNIYYSTTTGQPRFYNGSGWASVGNTNTLAQTLSNGNTTNGSPIDFQSQQAQHMVLFNNNGSPGTGTGGYVWYDTGVSEIGYETSGNNHYLANLDGSQTLTNKSISGSANTLTNVPDSALSSNVGLLNGNQSITGTKTFSAAPVLSTVKTGAGDIITLPAGGGNDSFAYLNKTQTLQATSLNAPTFLNNTNFSEGIAAQFRVENLTSDPAPGFSGRIYYKTTTGELKYDDGTNIHVLTANNLATASFTNVEVTGTLSVIGSSSLDNGGILTSGGGVFTAGAWNATPIAVTYGGTGINTGASTGVPSVAAGVWTVSAGLAASLGGTGINTGASTGAAQVSGGIWTAATLPVSDGGTGITSGTQGGIAYFSSTAQMASSALPTTHGVLLSEGASSPPTSTAAGTSGYPLLSGGSGSDPSYAQLNLTSGVTGTLPVGSGGTGLASTTMNQLLYSSGTNTITGLTTGNNGTLITSSAGVPSISSTLPTAVQGNITGTGTISSGVWNGTSVGPAYGGTGLNTLAQYNVLLGNGTNAIGFAAPTTAGYALLSNGATANPSFQSITSAFTAPVFKAILSTGSSTGRIFFLTTGSTVSTGDVYATNGSNFTVLNSVTNGVSVFFSGTLPTGASTVLVKQSGNAGSTTNLTYSSGTSLLTATYTPSLSPLLYLKIRMIGAGGGGGGGGSSGGSNGSNGTTTYFGANLLTGNGGFGGGAVLGAGGLGGQASLGGLSGLALTGGGGGSSPQNSGSLNEIGGLGGNGIFGGGAGMNGVDTVGLPGAPNTGGGGSGGGEGSAASGGGGGGGAGGGVETIIPTPASSYPYIIGVGGSAGSAGASGQAGGRGADGNIEIEEHPQ